MEDRQEPPKDITALVKPYTFVLQEGEEIRDDYLDYSLRLLIGRPEVLRTTSNSVEVPKKHFAKVTHEPLSQEAST